MAQVKKDRVRQRILKAAEKEFLANGFAGAGLRSIAVKAGSSLSNVYNYFDNKDSLFQAVLEPCSGAIERFMHRQIPQYLLIVPQIEEFVDQQRQVAEYLDEHRALLKLLFWGSSGSSLEDYQNTLYKKCRDLGFKASFAEHHTQINYGNYQFSPFLVGVAAESYFSVVLDLIRKNENLPEMTTKLEQVAIFIYSGFQGYLGQQSEIPEKVAK